MKDVPLTAAVERDLGTLRTTSIRDNFGINLAQHPDFTWALATRVLFYLGNALGTALLLYFFTFGVGADSPTDLLIEITLVYVLVTVITSVVAGRMSDTRDRRKVFVVVGGILQAASSMALAVSPTVAAAFVAAALVGVGWGSFMAVDQAIATGVLPDAERRGQHLGVMDIAVAVPQNVGPLIGALIVAATGGFVGLFVVSAAASVLAAIFILRVKAVK
jgi:MFS family permease